MRKRHLAKLLVTISMLSLGGCKFFGGLHFSGNSHDKAASSEFAQVTYGPATQHGREYLRSNLIGLAIESFNLALGSGEDPAAAYNGLGVAYSRLGRADLGYRFFKKATMSDPANPVYAQNLVKLVNSNEFTLNLLQRTPLPETAPADARTAARTAQEADRAERVPGKLYRERDRQFSLITVAPPQETTGTAPQNAAFDGCAAQIGRNARRRCAPISLPKVESRTRQSHTVALAVPVTPTQPPAGAASSAQPVPAKGKTKVFDLTSPAQPGTAVPKAEPDRLPAAAAAT